MILVAQVFLTIVCCLTTLNSQISNDFILPNTTEPVAYVVIMSTNVPAATRAFTGVLSLTLRVVAATNEIFLHSRQHRIDEYALYELRGSEFIELNDILLSRENEDVIKITSTEELKVGSTYELQFQFQGNLLLATDGFFRSDYVTHVNGSDVYT
jgi:Peptidase M1 N-terminal domain